MTIREGIEILDNKQINLQVQEAEDGLGESDTNAETLVHISIGSPLKSILLSEVEQQHSNDSAFLGFRKKANIALKAIISSSFENDSDSEQILYPSNENHQVRTT